MLHAFPRRRSVTRMVVPAVAIRVVVVGVVVRPADAGVFDADAEARLVFAQGVLVGKGHAALRAFDRLIAGHFGTVRWRVLVRLAVRSRLPNSHANAICFRLNDVSWI